MTCKEADDGFRLDVSWVGPVRLAAAARTPPRHRPPGARLARARGCCGTPPACANPLDRPVVLASPAANGRAGRGLRRGVLARADLGAGPDRARARAPPASRRSTAGCTPGCSSPAWTRTDGLPWSVLFVPLRDSRSLPWFVRLRDYPALGPALAWDRPQTIAAGQARRPRHPRRGRGRPRRHPPTCRRCSSPCPAEPRRTGTAAAWGAPRSPSYRPGACPPWANMSPGGSR